MKEKRRQYLIKWNKSWRDMNRDEYRSYHRDYARRRRLDVINHYGGKCICCGESNYEFLTIDHINGGGLEHRRKIKESGLSRWLKSNNYPSGFQVLCYNCNNAKSNYGECPHKKILNSENTKSS